METHKYRVGDIVSYRRPSHGGERGSFAIDKLIPANAVENQYRLVRSDDGRRAQAGESELSISVPPIAGSGHS